MGFCGYFHGLQTPTCVFLFVLSDTLNELFQRENRVLHYWTMRKRRLDQCQQYVVFERSAKQVGHLAGLPGTLCVHRHIGRAGLTFWPFPGHFLKFERVVTLKRGGCKSESPRTSWKGVTW